MTLAESVEAMVDALQPLTLEVPGLQIVGRPNENPTPPSIDIYPPDPFQEGSGFGVGSKKVSWLVRARVSTSDPDAAFGLLLRLLDVDDPASVEAALANGDPPAVVGNDGTVSGLIRYADDATPDLVGVQWRVEMFV